MLVVGPSLELAINCFCMVVYIGGDVVMYFGSHDFENRECYITYNIMYVLTYVEDARGHSKCTTVTTTTTNAEEVLCVAISESVF